MNRGEIIERFRQENPEATTTLISNAVLQSWCEVGDLEVCTKIRLIKDEATFSSIINQRQYLLTAEITKFYDIDMYPGGGVCYNNKYLNVTTPANLNQKNSSWRSSTGSPSEYYRRGGYLYFDKKPESVQDILVSTVLLPDPLDDDLKEPFNELSYLKPFHYALVLYLKFRLFNGKIKKENMAELSKAEYSDYIMWMDKEIDRGVYSTVQFRPRANMYNPELGSR